MTTKTKALQVGDILKWEATPLTRYLMDCPAGTKAGDIFAIDKGDTLKARNLSSDFTNVPFVALSDEKNGVCEIQPFNAVVDASVCTIKANHDNIMIKMLYKQTTGNVIFLGVPKLDGV